MGGESFRFGKHKILAFDHYRGMYAKVMIVIYIGDIQRL